MLRAARHIHKTGDKYKFEITVKRCALRVPDSRRISVEFIRGTKRWRIKESVVMHKSQWVSSFTEPFSVIATLFRSTPSFGFKKPLNPGENVQYDRKEAKLSVVDIDCTRPAGRRRKAFGEAIFDLAPLVAACKESGEATVHLRVRKCLDPKASISLSIKCEPLGISEGEKSGDLNSGSEDLEAASDASGDEDTRTVTPTEVPRSNASRQANNTILSPMASTAPSDDDHPYTIYEMKILALEKELHEANAKFETDQRACQEQLRDANEEMYATRTSVEERRKEISTSLFERDRQVAKMVESLSEMKAAVEGRGGKQPDEVACAALRDEISALTLRLAEAHREIVAYQKAWDIERARRSLQAESFENFVAQQQKDFAIVKSSLERQLAVSREDLLRVNKKAAYLSEKRQEAERELQTGRKSERGETAQLKRVALLEERLKEATAIQEAVQTRADEESRRLQHQIELLVADDQRATRYRQVEQAKYDSDRKALKDRIMELEKLLVSIPQLPSMARFLQTELSQVAFKRNQEESGASSAANFEVMATLRSMEARIAELEEELVQAKLRPNNIRDSPIGSAPQHHHDPPSSATQKDITPLEGSRKTIAGARQNGRVKIPLLNTQTVSKGGPAPSRKDAPAPFELFAVKPSSRAAD